MALLFDSEKNTPKSLRQFVAFFRSSQLIKNVGANIAGGLWNGLLIVLVTPWYVSLLGMEGYGLLGFWALMQMVLSLCDLGLGATIVREFADSQNNKNDHLRKRDLLRTMEWIYWPLAFIFTVILFMCSGWIANHWLKLQVLSTTHVSNAIRWMALALGMQFPCALYSSGLAGLQLQGRMNFLQMVGNALRYGGGIAVLFWKADLVVFFALQAFVAGAQTLATKVSVWRVINFPEDNSPIFRFEFLKNFWRFSLGMALTMAAGVLLANVDRLFLSKLVPVEELGKYSLAVMATGLLQVGVQPFYRAYFPKFAELISREDMLKLRDTYYRGCRVMAAIIIPLAILGWAFAPQIFMIWIGRTDKTIINAFRLLLLGVSCAGLMWLPAAFQQAHGWTRLHAAMLYGALFVGAPILFWMIEYWGTVGAATIWVLHGVSDVTLGLFLMHKRLLPGELVVWYRYVIWPPLLWSMPIVGLSWWLFPAGLKTWPIVAWIGTTSLIVLIGLIIINLKEFHSEHIHL